MLRPVDLARRHGLSAQAIRNYESQGILPSALRTASGHRRFSARHALALDAFLALVPGCGHASAAAILRAVQRSDLDEVFAGLGAAHLRLAEERATLRTVRDALTGMQDTTDLHRTDSFVGDVAHQLDLSPATVREWERRGIVDPRRDPHTGYRIYSAADIRDARMAHQLRRGGYSLAHIAVITEQVRSAGGIEPLRSTLDGWQASLTHRGRALLRGSAALSTLLDEEAIAHSSFGDGP